MTSKISVAEILKHHFVTYKDENGKNQYVDWLVLLGLPLGIAAVFVCLGVDLTGAYANIVTVGAIFAGLLLNLLILIYDQKAKLDSSPLKGDEPGYNQYSLRLKVICEVHANISYSIVVCLIAVMFAVIGSTGWRGIADIPKVDCKIEFAAFLVDFPLIVLSFHLVLTIFMVLKRVHRLMVVS